ncbi:MAG: NAD(P)/FAD-dependent oxidoreductase [Cyanobacteriota bacterium]|nr:NAD(P)/FAD-dependent oxidoreductase [Cyanobacteriota bacterium]
MVGGGPTGFALSWLLARAGWGVTLVEAMAPGAPRPYRGEGLMPSGIEALEAMGLWPLPAGVRHRPLGGWAVVLEGRPFFTAAEPLAGDRGCWLVDQESLLAHLRGELRRHGGTRLLEGAPMRGVLRADGRVRGVVLADGQELVADLVVGCDGRHSALRQLAQLNLEPGGAQEPVQWFRLAGPAVAPLQEWLAGRFLTVVAEGESFALFAEAAGEALRLGWVADAGVASPEEAAGWRERWCGALPPEGAALLGEVPPAGISGPQRFPVQVGWAPRWHAPGLLLLGDAAHPMSPVRAQGINMALRDALVAARLLGPVASATPHGPGVEREERLALIDALLPRIAQRRLPEIRQMQHLQAEEGALGARLRQMGWLRRLLAASAPVGGALARQRWIQRQHRLRRGRPEALALPK